MSRHSIRDAQFRAQHLTSKRQFLQRVLSADVIFREILRGTLRAPVKTLMIARRFEDLIVWQLAVALRRLIYRLTRAGPAAKDFLFRDQIRDSAASAPRNISEGFKRFDPPEFANFMKIALASLGETQNHLLHGRDEKYFNDDQFTEAWRLNCRAPRAGNRLHAYLRACPKKRS